MSRGVVAQVRDVVPIRPMTRAEAMTTAERQAQRLLELMNVRRAPFPEDLIINLPRFDVVRAIPFPASAASHWTRNRWHIVLNGAESLARQRFSLAHELKHVLDHPFVAVLHGGIDHAERAAWEEHVCDYFAGCLLMPRAWLKRAWDHGLRDPIALADLFEVTIEDMSTRLRQIGLLTAECSPCDVARPSAE